MNLRSNKGFTGSDILISIVVLIIFIPTIFGVVYNVNKTNKHIIRESRAVNIATEILESAKTIGVQGVTLADDEEFCMELISRRYELQETDGTNAVFTYEGENEEHYRVSVTLTYPNDEENDLVKLITVEVEYPIGNTTKTIEISTVLKLS